MSNSTPTPSSLTTSASTPSPSSSSSSSEFQYRQRGAFGHHRRHSHGPGRRDVWLVNWNNLLTGVTIGLSLSWLAYHWWYGASSSNSSHWHSHSHGLLQKKWKKKRGIWKWLDRTDATATDHDEEKTERKLNPIQHPDVINTNGLPPTSSSSALASSSSAPNDFPLSFGSRTVIGRSHGARPSVLSDWYFVNDGALLALSTPICLAATYRFRDGNQAARLCANDTRVSADDDGFLYARWSNPTNDAAARTIANLEGAKGTLLFASGMSAISSTLSALLGAGDHMVCARTIYGGALEYLNIYAKKNGIEVTYVAADKIENFAAAIKSNTKLIYAESPSNPTVRYTDLFGLGAVALSRNVLLVVDSTFATPFLIPALRVPGVSVSIHSCTKYLGGHSDLLAGAASSNDEELLKKICKAQKILGGTLDAFQSFLLIRGLKTLHVRMPRHGFNALTLAQFLEKHPAIEKVYYPGLPSHPDHVLARKLIDTLTSTSAWSDEKKADIQLNELYDGVSARGFGGMIAFEVRGGVVGGRVFCEALRLINLAVSLGSVESLICHPASMTHMMLPRNERIAAGVTDGLIRFSVGIEDVRDLLQDLKQALEVMMKNVDYEKEERAQQNG